MCQLRLEGITALYSGLAPGLQRQAVFSSLRIGLYERVRNRLFSRAGISQTSTGGEALLLRVLAGLTSGSVAISVAQPMDVVKIRQAHSPPLLPLHSGFDQVFPGCRRRDTALGTEESWTPTCALPGGRDSSTVFIGELGQTSAGMPSSTPVRLLCTT